MIFICAIVADIRLITNMRNSEGVWSGVLI